MLAAGDAAGWLVLLASPPRASLTRTTSPTTKITAPARFATWGTSRFPSQPIPRFRSTPTLPDRAVRPGAKNPRRQKRRSDRNTQHSPRASRLTRNLPQHKSSPHAALQTRRVLDRSPHSYLRPSAPRARRPLIHRENNHEIRQLHSWHSCICSHTGSSAFWHQSHAAQTGGNTGNIAGTVTDPSGAVIAGAAITIHNPVSGLDRVTATDTSGNFSFVNVPFNPYHLTVTAMNFAQYAQDVDVRSVVATTVKISARIGRGVQPRSPSKQQATSSRRIRPRTPTSIASSSTGSLWKASLPR